MPANTCRSLVMAATLAFVCALNSPAAAQTSSTVAGTVKDTQGGIIPGATVTLISETRGTTFEARRGARATSSSRTCPADTYTIRVTMDGFKTTERKGVAVSLATAWPSAPITIEVGTLAETVLVTGDAPMIQAQTGERSFTVTKETVENLPVSGRNFASFAALAPGVVVSGNDASRASTAPGPTTCSTASRRSTPAATSQGFSSTPTRSPK